MSIDGVNNSGSNAGLYAGGAALVGAGAGIATGYLTKPFLKDGAPTDSFVKEIKNNMIKAIEKRKNEIDNIKSVDELKEFVKNNKELKKAGMSDVLLEQLDNSVVGFDSIKASLTGGAQFGADVVSSGENIKSMFDMLWDKKANKFVDNAEDITKDGFEAVKNAAKKIQGKAAIMYGAIGAGVLGLATLLCCSGGKKEVSAEASQKVDTQV